MARAQTYNSAVAGGETEVDYPLGIERNENLETMWLTSGQALLGSIYSLNGRRTYAKAADIGVCVKWLRTDFCCVHGWR